MAGNGVSTPGWTDGNDADPGIALLQFLPFLAIPLIGAVIVRRWRRRRSAGGTDHRVVSP